MRVRAPDGRQQSRRLLCSLLKPAAQSSCSPTATKRSSGNLSSSGGVIANVPPTALRRIPGAQSNMALPPRPRLSLIQRAISASRSTSAQPPQPPQPPQPNSDPTPLPPKITQIPDRLRSLEPADPPLIPIQDPVFITRDAATILGLKSDRLEKWRQRGLGPDYLRYPNGYVRYELSALNNFKSDNRIRPSRKPRRGSRQEP